MSWNQNSSESEPNADLFLSKFHEIKHVSQGSGGKTWWFSSNLSSTTMVVVFVFLIRKIAGVILKHLNGKHFLTFMFVLVP